MLDVTQTPLPSGFGWQTTAAQVLSGLDLRDRRAVITGGHSGIGRETTRALAAAGARVVVGARAPDAARAALDGIPGVSVVPLDLADLDSVAAAAAAILRAHPRIDLLINNAGVMACPETRVGPRWELQFASNHLGHYALTNRLWPALRGGARVIVLSSAAHHYSTMRWDDVHFEQGYDKWLAYGQSKTANALFACHLDRRGRTHGVRAFSVHPGVIATPLQRHIGQDEMRQLGWIDAEGKPAIPDLKTPEQGAATTLWAATSARLEGLGGRYCEDVDIAAWFVPGNEGRAGVKPHALDPDQAERLWAYSARLTGVDAFAAEDSAGGS
ncbi:SDR family NAD(P)-dependent oxidoreductase [Pseudoxanthomonas winnipegensis]|uniref:SDR family NAD(P)-dependent oxidoreductase n=1 Tax=Pseudoxanthomonas winnipegensis TaxID=2480810 RepID=A0ABY1WCP1_9GAMM|nr:SDR family NAD(P)-dependent oxidoreductase [Pseudoxanthomonas winnipegensis]TAA18776.1 SDR family NAD(P)-dependent oxidoreductase [Pseudoxanthomonas winnipegensis]TAH74645.1 SDR family NAD(P)-dependent oxidoreductase [Pseudoxanthomonas winnipegensis]